jgi:menaquinone-dependent protoporphyrinogen IX oxidase
MSNNNRTRRQFLMLTAAVTGACALSCVGMGALLSKEDLPGPVMPIGFPEFSLEGNSTKKKILVTYTSNTGSTGGVAEVIGRSLAETGRSVDVRLIQSVNHLDDYAAVVLGSPINNGKWLPSATEFVVSNHEKLRQIPTAFFLVGLMANKENEANRKLVDQFLADERALVPTVAEGRFVGVMFITGYSGLEKLGMHFFIAFCGLGLRGGDFRNPATIRAWTESICPLLIQ